MLGSTINLTKGSKRADALEAIVRVFLWVIWNHMNDFVFNCKVKTITYLAFEVKFLGFFMD